MGRTNHSAKNSSSTTKEPRYLNRLPGPSKPAKKPMPKGQVRSSQKTVKIINIYNNEQKSHAKKLNRKSTKNFSSQTQRIGLDYFSRTSQTDLKNIKNPLASASDARPRPASMTDAGAIFNNFTDACACINVLMDQFLNFNLEMVSDELTKEFDITKKTLLECFGYNRLYCEQDFIRNIKKVSSLEFFYWSQYLLDHLDQGIAGTASELGLDPKVVEFRKRFF